ncbi:MAG: hypothetical protein CMH48_02570 [Muricauda sp.]|nr:hypothetical protein [Allomuricauda sp.]MAU26534.1 hypothetical protein [Allomuricauda sp.]MBC29704.1 hypothetical protein [Allomuricauda sp.]|tara:strand:+ start:9715 stop:10377 length:663 start_codon:yes stop_codon:yes gene_type:complete
MKKIISFIAMALLFAGCSSTSLVSNWKNPDIVIFDANKVLLVGMTADTEAREMFESELKKEFDRRGVESFRSIDLFDVEFTETRQSEEQLNEVEQQLLDKDFDAILFTKIVGSENRKMFKKNMGSLGDRYGNFSDDYLDHQDIFYETGYYDNFTVYHAETSLYCICVGKERELIWRGAIDITDPQNIKKTIKDYVRLVILALQEQDIIFRKPLTENVTKP